MRCDVALGRCGMKSREEIKILVDAHRPHPPLSLAMSECLSSAEKSVWAGECSRKQGEKKQWRNLKETRKN